MKTASAALQTHIAGALTTLTTCLKITRTDDVVLAFTALDQPFTFEDVLHKPGYDPTAIVSADQLNVDNVEWAGVVDHEDLTSEDIRAGKYDDATWEQYRVNWADLTQGKIILKTGTIGNVNLNYPNEFIAEGRSLTQALQVKLGRHYTPHCKWDLGDGRCQFQLVGEIGEAGQAGVTIAVWQANHAYVVGDLVSPTVPNGWTYRCIDPGTSGATEPDWDAAETDTAAGTQSYLTNPGLTDNKGYVITPAETGGYTLTGPVGELGSARWAFLTDGIRAVHQIIPFTNQLENPNDGTWKAQNDILSGVIEAAVVSGRTVYTLTLNTFDDTVYTNDEVDLFVCAVSPLPDVTVNEPGILPFAQQQFIGALDSLTLTWTQSVITAQQGTRNGGGVDCAIAFISVYFKNTVTDETLQYQIYTYDTRGFAPDAFWFNSTGPFYGVADNISRYGDSYLTVGGSSKSFEADILARVIALMAACPNPGIDEDPDHWKITLLSVGPFTNGEASITSTVSNVNLLVGTPAAPVPGIVDGGVMWERAAPAPTDPPVPPGPDEPPTPGPSGIAPGSYVTPATVATVIDPHWEFTAATTGTQLVTNSQVPVPFWQPKHLYWPGDSVRPTDTDNQLRAVAVGVVWDEKKKTGDVPSGTSGGKEPDWPTEAGERVEDNEVEWGMVEDQWYKDGVLRFTSGPNAVLHKQFEVLWYEVTGSSARFRLVLPTPYPIAAGHAFIVEAGCDKTHMTCIYKFNNILNFGGEPYVAGFNRPHDTPTDENLES